MNSLVFTQLSESARDFQNIVWPLVSKTPLVDGGLIRPVEAVAEKDFKDELDLLAGIDAWQVQYNPTAMRGIASRVQWGGSHDSFSVRTRLPSGNETEFQKRLRAIQNSDSGHLFPHVTIQAYLNVPGGILLAAAAIKTIDLISAAALLMENRAKLYPRPEFYGFISNTDGTEFLYMRWSYLQYKGLLNNKDIVRAPT
jgi:hypothetical protein